MTIQLLYDNGQSEWILFYNDRTGNWEDDNNIKKLLPDLYERSFCI
jgi:hypothetical protein